jgi:hypothetical protein
MGAAILRNLQVKTGRTLEEWKTVVRALPEERRKDRVARLKREYGLGHVTAELLVDRTTEADTGFVPLTPEDMLTAQYAGPKAALRPIYDRVITVAQSLGTDVRCEPRYTYVSMSRKAQFGVVQASTRTRVDLGLRLPGVEPDGRLQPAGSFGSGGVTHKVALTSPVDVDDELTRWLQDAYGARG